jgi:hypothetical protein
MARFNLDKEQAKFMDDALARLPSRWAQGIRAEHQRREREQGPRGANIWLDDYIQPYMRLLDIAKDDTDLQALADKCAFYVREQLSWKAGTGEDAMELIHEKLADYDVKQLDDNFSFEQKIARYTCKQWWLRNLRQSHARAREASAIDARLVHRKANLYCSDDTLERRAEQLNRNKALLAGITMQNEDGLKMTLEEIAQTGMANQANKRAELMTRITGFEEIAKLYNHDALFVTITCPSRMHAINKNGVINKKYDGTKPSEAQAYLVQTWAKVRAKLHRDGVSVYGLRVAEPHHDGTPHWHMMLFFKKGKIQNSKVKIKAHLMQVIETYFLQDSWQEFGAMANRVKFVHIDPSKGTASGYVMKYVAKNIGGITGEYSDEGGILSEDASARVEAWASTWRIRQFQQVGGHSVTVWRELRRIPENIANCSGALILRAWVSAQKVKKDNETKKASFAQFIEAMGGVDFGARESRLCIDDDYITKRGRYGDAIVRVINGVRERFGLCVAKSNRQKWERVK